MADNDRERATRLIWIDLEMTGLDVAGDSILEIATIVTDADLVEIAEGPNLAIHHSLERLQAMGEWCTRTHQGSGLWQRVLDSDLDMAGAERRTLEFLQPLVDSRTSPMCGNSICNDRRFLARLMPELEAYFHYRHVDVTTLKELYRRWAPERLETLEKANLHTALSDVRESIEELRFYRRHLAELVG